MLNNIDDKDKREKLEEARDRILRVSNKYDKKTVELILWYISINMPNNELNVVGLVEDLYDCFFID
jgi:hypothetical protein